MVVQASADKKRTEGMEQETDAECDTRPHPSESGKVSWVLNKGLRLGKRILVAGFVVSTVPVVLPPLVVVSTIGIVFSLPYGFYLASYACTEKLMDKLLPAPTSLDYGLLSDLDERQDQEDYYGAGGGRRYLGESGLEGVIDVDKEENQQMEEAKIGYDMRIDQLAEPEEDGDFKEERDIAARNDDGRGAVETEADMQPLDYGVVQHGFAEDGSRTEESQSDMQFDCVRQDEVDITVAGNIPESRLTGAQEMVIIVEGMDDNKNNVENYETPLTVDEFRDREVECGMKDQELERETKGLLGKIRDQSKAEMLEPLNQILQGATKKGDRKMNMSEDKKAKCIKNMGDVVSGDIEEGKQVKEEEEIREQMEAVDLDAYQTQMETSDPRTRGGAGSNAVKNRKKSKKSKVKSRTRQNVENVTSETVAGVNESLASSVVVRNKNNVSIAVKSEVSSKTVEGREKVGEEHKHHLSSPSALQEGTKTLEEQQLDEDGEITDNSHANEKGIDSPSDEVMFTRKKIREQIDAMRRIVGYEGTTHVSYIEELKALYVFTGVEPPACFNDTSDLADISHKLRFLMSIVGVK